MDSHVSIAGGKNLLNCVHYIFTVVIKLDICITNNMNLQENGNGQETYNAQPFLNLKQISMYQIILFNRCNDRVFQ